MIYLCNLYEDTGKLGGPRTTIEIDETKITNRKYNKCRAIKGIRVGMIDKDSKELKL